MLCASKEQDFQKKLKIWKEDLMKKAMKTNTSKTKVIVIGNENKRVSIVINDEQVCRIC